MFIVFACIYIYIFNIIIILLSNISQHCQAVDIFSYGSLINAYSKALYWAEPIDLLKDAHICDLDL